MKKGTCRASGRMLKPQPDKPAYTIVNNTVHGTGIDTEMEKEFRGWDAHRRTLFAQSLATYICHLTETASILQMAEKGGRL